MLFKFIFVDDISSTNDWMLFKFVLITSLKFPVNDVIVLN